jgi:ubiquinone biosynthesis protein UbiJ
MINTMDETMSVPADQLSEVANQALLQLEERQIVERLTDTWRVLPESEAVLRFYANSIAHYYPENDAAAE